MTPNRQTTVVGVFNDRVRAQEALREVRAAGFSENQIGLIAREGDRSTADAGDNVLAGATAGAAAGAGVGALWALGIAAGVLPGIGPVVAGGLLGSLLASAAGGAAVASIVGLLVGLGIPEDEAAYYDSEFKAGHTIVTVRDDARADEAWAILRRHGAYNMHHRREAATARPM